MQKYIIITTIHPKSAGIAKFEQMKDWQIILVGDRKSVPVEPSENLTFLSVADQRQLGYAFEEVCPYDHYARKNIGYLYALQQGADIIFDTDDDNLPYPHWSLPEFYCNRLIAVSRPFVNVYKYFTDTMIWPRGFPLDEIQQPFPAEVIDSSPLPIGVWQGLADCDPDVDAIYRLLFDQPVKFEEKPAIALNQGCYFPFNSQNTFWHHSVFPFLYLPATASFRFTDILRGYVAQSLMWQQGRHLGVTGANVYQERNAHNLMKDFAEEIEAYLHVKKVVNILNAFEMTADPLYNLEAVYQTLTKEQIVKPQELELCQTWIRDFKTIAGTI
jgi:hypothetical protein